MDEVILNRKDMIVMKLLHYFITVKNYTPIILQGAQDEIWLENLNDEYQIIRIVSNYLHNDEQFSYDQFRAKKISGKISKKVFSYNMNILNIYTDLGDNVHLNGSKRMEVVSLYEDKDILNNELLNQKFPDISNKVTYNEEGVELFVKITNDINTKNKTDAERADEVFRKKLPIITYILIGISVIMFLLQFLFNMNEDLINKYALYGPYVRDFKEYYRLITSGFLHADIFHILFNMYALYVLGSQLESYLGKYKYTIVYFFSLILGSLMSITFSGTNSYSIGASGAIFGLMGSLVAFGYYYRVYLGEVLKNQIIPLIIVNLLLSVTIPGIDVFAHIGGLIAGFLITMALGVKYKGNKIERINGIVMTSIFTIFMIYMGLFMAR
jgi:rhomboid protease GluP